MWSVTSIIGDGVPKPALVNWKGRQIGELAYENLDTLAAMKRSGDQDGAVKYLLDKSWAGVKEAQARGTELHEIAESYALGAPIDPPEHLAAYIEHYVRFLEEHRPVYEMSEAPVYNLTYHYAGTLDAIAVIDGKRVVLDMKTTPKAPGPRVSRPPYPEVALQLVAYSRAEKVGITGSERLPAGRGGKRYYLWSDGMVCEPMPEVDGAFSLVLSPHDYQLVPVRIDSEVWTSFLYVREVARWQNETSKNVLGNAVEAAA